MPPVIAAAGLALSAVGTYVSIKAGKASAKAQSRSLDLQREADRKRGQFRELQRARQRQATIREFVRKRAAAVSTATQAGAGIGSAIAGATGALRTGTQGQLTFLDQASQLQQDISTLGNQASVFQNQITSAQQRARIGASLVGVGSLAFRYNKTISRLGKRFSNFSIFDTPDTSLGGNTGTRGGFSVDLAGG